MWLQHSAPSGQQTVVGPLHAEQGQDPELGREILIVYDASGSPHVYVSVESDPDEPDDIWWSLVHQSWVRVTELPASGYHAT